MVIAAAHPSIVHSHHKKDISEKAPLSEPLSSEIQLLLHAALPGAEPANDARIGELLNIGLDWDLVLQQARAHGTLPLLHWHLKRQGWEAVPAAQRDSLRDEFRQNAALNLVRTSELLSLLRKFRARGISVLPFKGPTLAVYAYGSLSLRQFNDLDLLLRPEDLTAGRDLLLADGYTSGLDLPAARQSDYLRAMGQMPFYRRRDGSLVELHSRVMPRGFFFPLGLEELWGRGELLSLQGEAVLVLSAEDLLLVLSAHGAKHLFACLGWVSDLAAVILSRSTLDVERALGRARELRSERVLLVGLRLGYRLLHNSPPEIVERRMRADPVSCALAHQVGRGLTHGPPLSEPQGAVFQIRVREHFKDGLVYSLSLALQPIVADWKFLSLPTAASLLYFFLRPLRLAFKYGVRLLGRCLLGYTIVSLFRPENHDDNEGWKLGLKHKESFSVAWRKFKNFLPRRRLGGLIRAVLWVRSDPCSCRSPASGWKLSRSARG
jgi:hypothetical protein